MPPAVNGECHVGGHTGRLTLTVVFWLSASTVTGPAYLSIRLQILVTLHEMIGGELVCVLRTSESGRTEFETSSILCMDLVSLLGASVFLSVK